MITSAANSLAPRRRQDISWALPGAKPLPEPTMTHNDDTHRNALIKTQKFSLNKMHLKMSLKKWRSFCPVLSVSRHFVSVLMISVKCEIFCQLVMCWLRIKLNTVFIDSLSDKGYFATRENENKTKQNKKPVSYLFGIRALQWHHNERDGVSNHRRFLCLLNCCFRRRSKKTSKRRVTGRCAGNSPVAGELPAQRASNAENVSIWWRHHGLRLSSKLRYLY